MRLRATCVLIMAALLAAAPAHAGDTVFDSARSLTKKIPSLRSTVSADERKVSRSKVKDLKNALHGARSLIASSGRDLPHPRHDQLVRAVANAIAELGAAESSISEWEAKYQKGKDVERFAKAAQEEIDDALEAWEDFEDEVGRSHDALEAEEAKLDRQRETVTKKVETLAGKRQKADAKLEAEFKQLTGTYAAWEKARNACEAAEREHDRYWARMVIEGDDMDASALARLTSAVVKHRERWQEAEREAWKKKCAMDREEADFEKSAIAQKRAVDAHVKLLKSPSTVKAIQDHNRAESQLERFRKEFGDV